MKTINHILRTSALPAIAAALALSSTSALAQQAQPAPTDPQPATPATDQAAPAPAAEPVVSDTSTAPPASDATVTSSTVKTASTSVPRSAKRAARPTHVAAKTTVAKPAAVTHVASRSATTHAVVPAAAATPVPPPSVQTSQSAVKPLVALNANPAPRTSAAAKPAKKHGDTLPIAGGALAFLAIGGAAVALTRRRHDDEEEWVEEGSSESAESVPAEEPVIHEEEPPMIAPASSAFSWGDPDSTREMERGSETAEDDDRLPGETWIQRAYRGPSANNPSVSLRARLKRAAFFDKRERDVAAGRAEPVEMDAGLPEAMVEEQQRELA